MGIQSVICVSTGTGQLKQQIYCSQEKSNLQILPDLISLVSKIEARSQSDFNNTPPGTTMRYLRVGIILIITGISTVCCEDEDIFEPEEWTGEPCTKEEFIEWGLEHENRGPGSCQWDCDCPPCSPYCNSFIRLCDNNKANRSPSARSKCLESNNGGHFFTLGQSNSCIKQCRLRGDRCVHRRFPKIGKC